MLSLTGGLRGPFKGVSLLTHFDGSFADSSLLNNSFTTVGTPSTTTVNPKWGTACYLGATLSGLRKTSELSAFSFNSTEDFTIECWAYTAPSQPVGILIGGRSAATPATAYILYVNNTGVYWLQDNAANLLTGSAPNNQWNHIAISRAAGTLRMFVGGVQQGAIACTRTYTCNQLNIGVDGSGTSNANGYTGRMDDLRVTKGTGLYTANFTPPSAAFPNP
jgi:hypothetical protein